MKRIHAVPLVLILGAAAGGGLIAVTQTASADTPAAATVVPVDIEQREAQVAQIEADLQAQLDQRPPSLPEVPSFEPAPEPKAKNAKNAEKGAPAQKVIVRTAAPAPAAAYEEYEEEEYEEADEYEEEEAGYEQEGDSEHDEREYEGGEDDD